MTEQQLQFQERMQQQAGFPGALALGFTASNNDPYLDFDRNRTLSGIEFKQRITLDTEDKHWFIDLGYYRPTPTNDGELLMGRLVITDVPMVWASPFDALKYLDEEVDYGVLTHNLRKEHGQDEGTCWCGCGSMQHHQEEVRQE